MGSVSYGRPPVGSERMRAKEFQVGPIPFRFTLLQGWAIHFAIYRGRGRIDWGEETVGYTPDRRH